MDGQTQDTSAADQRAAEEQAFREQHPKLVAAGDAEAASTERCSRMTFSEALAAIKNGARAAREGWNGTGMFIFLVSGSTFEVNREPLLSILGAGRIVNYQPHIDMHTAQGTIVPWLASQSDLLAGDWYLTGDPHARNAAA